MNSPLEFSIFSSLPEYSAGDKMSLPYLFHEKGMLLDLDPEENPDSQTSLAYYPLQGSFWEWRSKLEQIDSVPNKLALENQPDAAGESAW